MDNEAQSKIELKVLKIGRKTQRTGVYTLRKKLKYLQYLRFRLIWQYFHPRKVSLICIGKIGISLTSIQANINMDRFGQIRL